MSFNTIIYEVEDHILTITLNRPDQLNSFTGEMMYELFEAFDNADADDEVRAIIITGAGRGFCAGADLTKGADTWEGHEEAIAKKKVGDGGGSFDRDDTIEARLQCGRVEADPGVQFDGDAPASAGLDHGVAPRAPPWSIRTPPGQQSCEGCW